MTRNKVSIITRISYRFLFTFGVNVKSPPLIISATSCVTPRGCLFPNLQPATTLATLTTLHKYSVKAVSIKKRGSNHSVILEPPTSTESTSCPISTTAETLQVDKNSIENDMSSSSSVVEAVVAKVGDLENGQMKEVEIGGKKVLLVKEDGQFYATGNKCTHYGAPLSKGALCNGVVRCPWHGACFNIKTGDIEDFPGLDSIHTFEVTVKGEDVTVKANMANLENTKRSKAMVKKSGDNKQTAVLVGGGPASLVCAQTLREEGFKGQIKIVCKEPHPPYDRIKLSKALGSKPEEIALRSKDYFDTNGIELILGKEVTALNPSNTSVSLSDGQSLNYNFLLLATGGQPRRLPIPGIDLKNIFFLRSIEDANAINNAAKDKNVVIIGSSFIGMEVAAYLADKASAVHVADLISVPFQLTLGKQVGSFMQQVLMGLEVATYLVGKCQSVHVIGPSSCPLKNVFGLDIGTWFQKMHEAKGVKFHFETTVKELKGSQGQVKEAVLSNGETLKADVVVMGVGVVPATEFLKGSGLEMSKVGYIPVNKKMETNLPGVYAAGDIAEFPLFTEKDKSVNIQHFQMAHKHGKTAALAMAGKPEDIRSVPYFWTVQYGKSIRYCGYGPGYDDVTMHGSLEENKFVAFYTKGDLVVAVASLGWDPIVSQAAELLSKGGRILKEDIQADPSSVWLPRLQQKL